MFRAVLLSLLGYIPLLATDTGYLIQTIAGTSNAGDNGPATAALLVQVQGVAIDGLGNIYVADAGDHRIRKINAGGIIQTIAGTGVAGFSGDGGPATAAQLNRPYGIALDFAGNVYFADLANARVRKVDTSGIITTVAGGGSLTTTQAASIQAKDAKLMTPRNVAVDIGNNIYISDFDAQQVYQVTPAGVLTVFAGTGKGGFGGDGGPATAARISYPAGLATDVSGNVLITDSGNGRLRRVWHGMITTVALDMPSPTGVAVDASGRVYAASPTVASPARVTSPAGLTVQVVGAEDVASDAGGTLYLATQHSIQKLVGTTSMLVAGVPGFASFGDGGPATAARLGGPVAMAVTSAGDIYIAEQSASRIRKIAANGTISIVVSDPAQLSGPSGIAVDSAGTIYFADTGNNRVRKIGAGGVVSTVVDKLGGPSCVRFGPDGSLYVCEKLNDRIVKISPAGTLSIAAKVSRPAGLAISNDGSIYVSTGAQVVQISPAGISTTVSDGLSGPGGLALNNAGELLIVESMKNRVVRLGAAGEITVVAGTGEAGFSGDAGPASEAQLSNPSDVVLDAKAYILIADAGNNRIRKLTPAPVAAPVVLSPLTVVSGASLSGGPIVANEIVTIFGSGFDPAHTQVMFGDMPAKIFYAGAKQLNVMVPATVQPNAMVTITVLASGSTVATTIVNTAASAPAIFTVSNGTGQAAALNEDGTVNAADVPQPRGGVIVLFLTGDGQNGSAVSVRIGDYAADVLYAGPAPGFPGLTQVNARVPAGFMPTGTQGVVVSVGGVSSQAGVTIAVR